ncbi:MAG: hypothetical protein ABR499_00925 [Gemmatimonadaceae bacterium]
MDESVRVADGTGTLYTTVQRAGYGTLTVPLASYGRFASGDFPGGAETFDDRETVSPATPGRPDERATPVVLSGRASSVGVALGAAVGLSPSA